MAASCDAAVRIEARDPKGLEPEPGRGPVWCAQDARFGVASRVGNRVVYSVPEPGPLDNRFTAVLNVITSDRQRRKRQQYNDNAAPPSSAVRRPGRAGPPSPSCLYGLPVPLTTEIALTADRARKARYMKRGIGLPGRAVGMTPAQQAKAEVYRELGYRVAGMVGVNLAVARPMVKAQEHIVQLYRTGREDGEDGTGDCLND